MSTCVARCDLVVVGAGAVGMAHAAEARRRGLTVIVLERDEAAVGASIRNFGHICTTAQPSVLQPIAQESRQGWLRAAERYGVAVQRHGTVLLADRPEAMAVLEQFALQRPGAARLLGAHEARELTGGLATAAVAGGAHFPHDLRVDPRTTVAALAAGLAGDGVEIRWRTHVNTLEDTGSEVIAETSRGRYIGTRAVVCVGHDLDYVAPDVADGAEVRRCRLSMLRLAAPGVRIAPAVLTVTSMLRYGAFAEQPGFAALRESLLSFGPELVEHVANLMCTQLPDGTIALGDTHHYGLTAPPFLAASHEDLILQEFGRLLNVRPRVVERWQGVYADSPSADLVEESVSERLRYVTVASGIGMTLCFGLACCSLDAWGLEAPAA